MRYFKQEDFNKCMEFLANKPDTVETQQELYKFMHEECHMAARKLVSIEVQRDTETVSCYVER